MHRWIGMCLVVLLCSAFAAPVVAEDGIRGKLHGDAAANGTVRLLAEGRVGAVALAPLEAGLWVTVFPEKSTDSHHYVHVHDLPPEKSYGWIARKDIKVFDGPFDDVPSVHWAAEAIARLKSKGFVKGESDNRFRGGKAFTRYEMAVVLDRYLGQLEKARSSIMTAIETIPLRANLDQDQARQLDKLVASLAEVEEIRKSTQASLERIEKTTQKHGRILALHERSISENSRKVETVEKLASENARLIDMVRKDGKVFASAAVTAAPQRNDFAVSVERNAKEIRRLIATVTELRSQLEVASRPMPRPAVEIAARPPAPATEEAVEEVVETPRIPEAPARDAPALANVRRVLASRSSLQRDGRDGAIPAPIAVPRATAPTSRESIASLSARIAEEILAAQQEGEPETGANEDEAEEDAERADMAPDLGEVDSRVSRMTQLVAQMKEDLLGPEASQVQSVSAVVLPDQAYSKATSRRSGAGLDLRARLRSMVQRREGERSARPRRAAAPNEGSSPVPAMEPTIDPKLFRTLRSLPGNMAQPSKTAAALPASAATVAVAPAAPPAVEPDPGKPEDTLTALSRQVLAISSNLRKIDEKLSEFENDIL